MANDELKVDLLWCPAAEAYRMEHNGEYWYFKPQEGTVPSTAAMEAQTLANMAARIIAGHVWHEQVPAQSPEAPFKAKGMCNSGNPYDDSLYKTK